MLVSWFSGASDISRGLLVLAYFSSFIFARWRVGMGIA